jgi:hypothetical protein
VKRDVQEKRGCIRLSALCLAWGLGTVGQARFEERQECLPRVSAVAEAPVVGLAVRRVRRELVDPADHAVNQASQRAWWVC